MDQKDQRLRIAFFTAYLVGALVLLLTGWLAYRSLEMLVDKATWVDHTNQVLRSSQATLSLLKDAETGQRGYALSRDSAYLEPYFTGIDSLDYYVSTLQSLTRDNARQQALIPGIRTAIEQKLQVMERAIALTNTHPERLSAFYASKEGKKRMDQVRRVLFAFEQEEKRLLAVRTTALDASIRRAQYTVYWIIISYVVIVLVTFTVLKYLLRKRVEYESQLRSLNEQLHLTNQELAVTNQELSATNEELNTTNEELQTTNEELSSTNEALHAAQQQLEQIRQELESRVLQGTSDLEQSQERFRLMVEALPHKAFTATPQGEIIYYNGRWYEYTGLARQGTPPQTWENVIPPREYELMAATWTRALKTGEALEMKNRFKRADGEYRWHLTRALPIRNEQGEITMWVGTATDIHEEITREQQLSQSNQRLEALHQLGKTISSHLELTRLIQAITDVTTQASKAEFGAFFYNTLSDEGETLTLYALSGAAREAFAHFPLPRHTAIFGPTFRGEGIMRVEDITQHENFGKNLPFKGMPKGHLPVKSYLSLPVISRSGKVLGGLFFGHSKAGVFTQQVEELLGALTPQVAIAIDHAFLFEASQTDRRNLAQANQELQQSNQELKLINQELDNFVYTASHDLKSPIVNIEGLLTALEKELGKPHPSAEKVHQMYQMLYSSVDRFKATIRDLTQVAHIGKESDEEIVPIPLAEVLREVQEDLSLQIQAAHGQLAVDLDCEVVPFSRKNLRSVLYNLLSNALKYRSPQRELVVRITCTRQTNYQVLSVQDNGMGLTSKQQEKLFGLFKRMHTHVEGSGIGLYMVKKIMENAGGKIEVESQLDVGSVFRVYFHNEGKVGIARQ
jgi:PAS domain S-box-containing protein